MNGRDVANAVTAKAVEQGLIIGAVLAVVLIASVFIFGGTHGQRCAKIADGDAAEQELCVIHISKGEESAVRYLKDLQERRRVQND